MICAMTMYFLLVTACWSPLFVMLVILRRNGRMLSVEGVFLLRSALVICLQLVIDC